MISFFQWLILNDTLFHFSDLPMIVVERGSVILENCRIHDCLAGGIVVQKKGNCEFIHCHIFNNNLSAIELRGSSSGLLENCKIENNERGALVWEASSLVIESCHFINNRLEAILVLGDLSFSQTHFWVLIIEFNSSNRYCNRTNIKQQFHWK